MDLEVGKKRFQLNGDHGHDDDAGMNKKVWLSLNLLLLNSYIDSEINRNRNRDIRRSSSKVYELEQERMKFIFVASFYGQQNFKHCNTFCFACSLTLCAGNKMGVNLDCGFCFYPEVTLKN